MNTTGTSLAGIYSQLVKYARATGASWSLQLTDTRYNGHIANIRIGLNIYTRQSASFDALVEDLAALVNYFTVPCANPEAAE